MADHSKTRPTPSPRPRGKLPPKAPKVTSRTDSGLGLCSSGRPPAKGKKTKQPANGNSSLSNGGDGETRADNESSSLSNGGDGKTRAEVIDEKAQSKSGDRKPQPRGRARRSQSESRQLKRETKEEEQRLPEGEVRRPQSESNGRRPESGGGDRRPPPRETRQRSKSERASVRRQLGGKGNTDIKDEMSQSESGEHSPPKMEKERSSQSDEEPEARTARKETSMNGQSRDSSEEQSRGGDSRQEANQQSYPTKEDRPQTVRCEQCEVNMRKAEDAQKKVYKIESKLKTFKTTEREKTKKLATTMKQELNKTTEELEGYKRKGDTLSIHSQMSFGTPDDLESSVNSSSTSKTLHNSGLGPTTTASKTFEDIPTCVCDDCKTVRAERKPPCELVHNLKRTMHEVDDLKAQLEGKSKLLQQERQGYTQLRNKYNDLEMEKNRLEDVVNKSSDAESVQETESLRRKLAVYSEKKTELKDKNSRLKDQLRAKDEYNSKLSEEKESLQNDLNEKQKILQKVYSTLRENLYNKQHDSESSLDNLSEIPQSIEHTFYQLRAKDVEIASLKKEKCDLSNTRKGEEENAEDNDNTVADKNSELIACKKQIKKLTQKVDTLQLSLSESESKSKEDIQVKESELTELAEQYHKEEQSKLRLSSKLQKMKDDNNILKASNKSLQDAYEDSLKRVTHVEAQIQALERETSYIRDEKDKLDRKHEEALSQKGNKTTKKLRDEITMLKEDSKSSKLQIKRLHSEIKRLEKENSVLKSKPDGKALQRELQLKGEMEQLQREKTDILSRLSEVASSKLREGNPNIADLSDERRPTKLAELFSELYDNEWTEAFDEQISLFHAQELDAIETLLNLLQKTHSFCHSFSTKYLESISVAASRVPYEDGGSLFKVGKTGDAPVGMNDMLRKIRTMSGPLIRCHIRKTLELTWESKGVKFAQKTTVYIDKCIEICWEMSVKDPPVVLLPLPKPGSPMDKDKYRFYTKTGPVVDFCVWPSLLLHEDGPLLAKGVIQGKSR